jgi:putative ABC transport system permease protein
MKILRKLIRNWQWLLINISGLALAFACVAMVLSYSSKELNYDRFHAKADRIYRATVSNQGASLQHPARVWGEWVPQLIDEYPAIESFVRMVPFKKGIVQIEEQRFYSDNLFRVDNSFFEIFDFKLLSGNRKEVLTEPGQVVLAKKVALKYFGKTDVLGEEIQITHQQKDSAVSYTVVGLMDDFPANSHFHADALTTIPDMQFNHSWGYLYYLLEEGTEVNNLKESIQQKWDENLKEGELAGTLHFQNLQDIHLHSHKTREIEANGDLKSIILLLSGALIILLIALINYLNLSRVHFLSSIKSIKIKMIHGASKALLAKDVIVESLVVSISAIALGIFISIKMGHYLKVDLWTEPVLLLGLSLLFILGIAALSVYPLFMSRILSESQTQRAKAGMYTLPLVVQFTLAVIAITGALVLQKQMLFLKGQHPQANNENIVVIERNPWNAVQRYESFKNELLSNSSIQSITGAMEEPGGDILDNFRYQIEGVEPSEDQRIYILTTDANFFSAMGIEPLAGTVELAYTPDKQWEDQAIKLSNLMRNENADQGQIDALYEEVSAYREQYIINESALKMLGIDNASDAIGREFRLHFNLPFLFPEGDIVGVVPDFHYTNLHNAERPLAIAPRKIFNYNFLIQIDPQRRDEALAAITATWESINPEFPLEYSFIEDSYEKVYATEYAQSKVLGIFALLSVILSAMGIYAIAAFSMQRRTKEIGIRKVNGASIGEIILMLNKKFFLWLSISFVVATPIAWYAVQRWLESFAYQTDLSWWIFALAGLITMTVALLTVSFQAYLVASRNPTESLRYE